MKTNVKEILLVGGMIFGSIAGAGFASGKEIWFYFAQFGWICYPLIIVTGILFCLFAFLCLEFGKKFAINSVKEMNTTLFHKLSFIAEVVFAISNLVLLSSMFAGADSLFNIGVNSCYRIGGIITALLTLFVVWLGFDKIVKVNCVIVPAMLIVVGITFCYCVIGLPAMSLPVVTDDWNFVFAIINCMNFVASNIYFAGFIFAKLGRVHSTKTNLLGSVLGASFMVVCILGMVTTIYLNPYSSMSDLPLIYIAQSMSSVFGVITKIVVWFGIFTTAITLLYAIGNWLQTYYGYYKITTIIISIFALCLSGLGFSNIINYFYPILGFFGVIYIITMCIVFNKNNYKINNGVINKNGKKNIQKVNKKLCNNL